MDALSNIANDDVSVERLLKFGLVELVLESMSANDWDEELSECTVKLLASISVGEECTNKIVEQGGVQLLLTSMESHDDQEEFLISAHIALSNVVIVEEAKKTVLDLKGIPLIIKQLTDFPDSSELTEKIVETLIRLSADDVCSERMSEDGMFVFCSLIDKWNDHVRTEEEDDEDLPSMLETIFALLGHMAFVTNNLRKMVQFGGVKKIISSIQKHSSDIDVMMKAVQTLDNIAMANGEYATIVIEEGGKDAISRLLEEHKGDEDAEELIDVCNSALLSMQALKRVASSAASGPSHKSMFAKSGASGSGPASSNAAQDQQEADKLKDKLAKVKNTLLGGKVVTVVQDRGGRKQMHILCSKDLRTFIFKEMKNASMGQTIKFDDVRRVAHGSILKSKKKSKLKPGEGQFHIECVQAVRSIDIITPDAKLADVWVDALEVLVTISRKYRFLLPDR